MDEDIPEFLRRQKDEVLPPYEPKPIQETSNTELLINEPQVKTRESIERGIRANASEYLTEINGFLDAVLNGETPDFNPYEYLRAREVKAAHTKIVIETFQPQLDEILNRNKCPQLKEGYARFTKQELNAIISFLTTLIDDAVRWIDTLSAAKGPRKKRRVVIKPEKKIKSLKYQIEDASLKLVSIPPEKIIGAMELWTYNTRYKHLTRYVARTRAGFSVKGTTLQDFDIDNSCTKVLRKPEEILGEVLKSPKKKILDKLTTKAIEPTGRINDKTILLKVL